MSDDVTMTRSLLLLLLFLGLTQAHASEDMYAAKRAIRDGDYAEAYCIMKPLAVKGDAEAQYQIGWMYHNGYGLSINDSKAVYWWEKSVKGGWVDAMMALVMLYREGGAGVNKDLPRAAKYLLQAAQKGDEEARLLLSYFLDNPDWALKSQLDKVLNSNPESLGPVMYVKVEKANLRLLPDTAARVIDTVGKGEKLILLAHRNDWLHVVYPPMKSMAWVHADLIGSSISP